MKFYFNTKLNIFNKNLKIFNIYNIYRMSDNKNKTDELNSNEENVNNNSNEEEVESDEENIESDDESIESDSEDDNEDEEENVNVVTEKEEDKNVIEFVKNKETKEPFSPELRFNGKVVDQCFVNGLLVYPGIGTVDGVRGDHIQVAPPLIINQDEINEIVRLLDKSISEVEQEVL